MLFVKPLLLLPPFYSTIGCPSFGRRLRPPLVQGLPFVRALPRALATVGRILFRRHELRSQLHKVVGVAFVVPEVHVVDLAVPAVATEPMHLKATRPALQRRTFL